MKTDNTLKSVYFYQVFCIVFSNTTQTLVYAKCIKYTTFTILQIEITEFPSIKTIINQMADKYDDLIDIELGLAQKKCQMVRRQI